MIKTGYVTETDGKFARIRIYRESACGGDCGHCNGCESGEIIVEAENIINAKVGETVKIVMENRKFFRNALLGYGSLVLALIVGGIFGYGIFGTDLASGAFAFLFLLLTLLIYRLIFKNRETNIKIERL